MSNKVSVQGCDDNQGHCGVGTQPEVAGDAGSSGGLPGGGVPGGRKRSLFARRRRRWWLVWPVVGVALFLMFSPIGYGFLLVQNQGGEMMSLEIPEDKKLTHEEAVAFVQAHQENIVMYEKRMLYREEEFGFIDVRSVELIPESVVESERKTPMTQVVGLIYYNFYINGNRDYEVIGNSMAGPNYRGNLPVTVGDPWRPGKVFGDGTTLSKKFNEISRGWDQRMNVDYPGEPPSGRIVPERDVVYGERPWDRYWKVVQGQWDFIQSRKDLVLDAVRERYDRVEGIPEVGSVSLSYSSNQDTFLSKAPAEGVVVFDVRLNSDRDYTVWWCAMVGPGYRGGLPDRADGRVWQEGDVYWGLARESERIREHTGSPAPFGP